MLLSFDGTDHDALVEIPLQEGVYEHDGQGGDGDHGEFQRFIQQRHFRLIHRIRAAGHIAQLILDQNFPQEVVMIPDNTAVEARFAEVTAVQDIFTSVLPEHEALTPDELLTRLNKRHDDMNRLNRNRHLIAGALAQGIIVRDANRRYAINNDRCSKSTLTKPDYDPLDDLIANIQKHNKIPNIPKGYPINSLTYFNRRARHSHTPAT